MRSTVPPIPVVPDADLRERCRPFGPVVAVLIAAVLFGASLAIAIALGAVALRVLAFPSWEAVFEWLGDGGLPMQEAGTAIGLVSQAILALLVVLVVRRRCGPGHLAFLGLQGRVHGASDRRIWIVLVILMAVEAVLLETYPDLIEPYDLPASPLGRTLGFVTLVVGAPLSEELLFRGFLQSNLRDRLSFVWTMLVTATLFALIHFDGGWAYPLLVFPTGLLLAYARETTGSLWPAVALHACINFVAFMDALWRSFHLPS